MKILLSIKPEYASRIFDGTKRFEYRRSIFTRNDVTNAVVYASLPIGKVIGEFAIRRVISASPLKLWRETRDHAGITKRAFFEYFRGITVGHAIEIKQYTLYNPPLPLYESFGVTPPQSFMYVNNVS